MPFKGFPAEAFDFFEGLEADNSKTYWQANKPLYDHTVKEPMEALLAELAPEFGQGRTFRPHRDVRFSNDKSPYKTNIGAVAERDGSVFYVSLWTGGIFAGSGYYRMARDQLERFRAAAGSDAGAELEALIGDAEKAGYEIGGEALKSAPRGYAADHPRIRLLRHKGVTIGRSWEPAAWMGTTKCAGRVAEVWRAAAPINGWLRAPCRPLHRAPLPIAGTRLPVMTASSITATTRFSPLTERPVVAAVAGASCIAFSGVLYRLSDVTASTAAVFRCAYALPILGVLAWLEDRRLGPRPARARRLAWLAGLCFAADLVLWHHAIEAVGAGLATVLGNLQVLVVGLAAWALLAERPDRALFAATPIVLAGVVLISGVVGEGAYGDDPALGVLFGALTSLAYAGFILVLRQGGRDLRRPAGPLFDATVVAAAGAAVAGAALGELDLAPAWPDHGWLALLALSVQVLGWLLISVSLPRLPAALTSMLLLLQPVGALVLAAIILGEDPSSLQLAGVVLILIGVVAATARRRPVPAVAVTPSQ